MKVLYLTSYDSSFLQNQILDLKRIGNIDVHYNIHIDSWFLLHRKKGKLSSLLSSSQKESLKKDEQSVIIYPGFPKEYLAWTSPMYIAWKLSLKFKKGSFNLIHAQNGFPSGYVAYLLAKKWNIPYIVTSHGMDSYRCTPESPQLGGANSFRQNVVALYKKALTHADKTIGVSDSFAKFIETIEPRANIMPIANSYNYSIFNTKQPINKPDNATFNEKDFIVLSTGYFIKRKGHIDIIKAIASLNNKNIKIVIIGGGPLRDFLLDNAKELNIADNILLINHIKQEELVNWYRAADLFIFPSIHEPFGLGLVEAMACGIPAIATKTFGPLEIIEEGKNGYLVDKHSPKQIANKVDFLFNNPEKLSEMGDYAAKSVYNRYAKKNEELFNLYKRVIKDYDQK
ncbi:MAG: hypothetical protein B6226_01720 [Candidatus Cloacimonetes bacterium 4572_65]|nr:MAG: hypothetical protein B6226_01720 [Candidatus Cloacimonetes bacterium 4572_65]